MPFRELSSQQKVWVIRALSAERNGTLGPNAKSQLEGLRQQGLLPGQGLQPEQEQPGALERFGAGLKRSTIDPIAAIAQSVGEPQTITGKVLGLGGTFPLGSVAGDITQGMVESQVEQFPRAIQSKSSLEAAGRGLAGLTPIAGPIAASLAERAGQGDVAGAIGEVLPLAISEALPRGIRAKLEAAKRKQISGLAATVSSGKGDIITRVIEPAREPLRNSAAELGLSPKDFKGIQGAENYVETARHAKAKVQAEFNTHLAKVADDVLPGAAIRENIMDFLISEQGWELIKNEPKRARLFLREARKLGDIDQTVAQWDMTRRRLNQEISKLQKSSSGDAIRTLRTQESVAAKKIALDTIRDIVYDHIESKTGVDVAKLKKTESALIEMEQVADAFRNRVKRKQARFDVEGYIGRAEKSAAVGVAFKSFYRVPLFRALFARFVEPSREATAALKRNAFSREPALRVKQARRAFLTALLARNDDSEPLQATIEERLAAQGASGQF